MNIRTCSSRVVAGPNLDLTFEPSLLWTDPFTDIFRVNSTGRSTGSYVMSESRSDEVFRFILNTICKNKVKWGASYRSSSSVELF